MLAKKNCNPLCDVPVYIFFNDTDSDGTSNRGTGETRMGAVSMETIGLACWCRRISLGIPGNMVVWFDSWVWC